MTVLIAIACGWGLLVAWPLVEQARRTAAGARTRALAAPDAAQLPAPTRLGTRLSRLRWPGPVGPVLTGLRRRREQRESDTALARELPVVVDLFGVAAAAGCAPYRSVEIAARWAPVRTAALLDRVLAATRLGAPLADALETVGAERPALRPLADALAASDRLGAPLRAPLARIAASTRVDLRRRAEKRARTLPVRLLFPLVFLVLPAFGLLTVAPAVLDAMSQR